jgi:uncharacterized protein (DUF4213/DUF364 family)
MTLRTDLQIFAASLARGRRVADARIGVGYSAVSLDNGQLGVAYTFLDGLAGGCDVYGGPRPLAGMPAGELLALPADDSALESALVLACINALVNTRDKSYSDGAAIENLDFRSDDRVGMIGHFAPIMSRIAPRVQSIEIFERSPDPERGIRAFGEAAEILPDCDIALITSTTLLNNSIEGILPMVQHCREVVMLGTSTPMAAEVFADTPVTLLSGILVEDTKGVLQAVSEGGGTPQLRPFTRKVNLRCA